MKTDASVKPNAPKTKPKTQPPVKEADLLRESPLEKNYTVIRKVNDERFGEIAVLEKKGNSQDVIMVKEKVTNDIKVAAQDIAEAKQRLQLSHPSLQSMIDYSCSVQKSLCSKIFRIRGFYEYKPNHLQKEIAHRQGNLEQFSSEELTNMLY